MNTRQTTVDPAIFSAYDVRGIYGENLTDEVAYLIGRAAAQYLNVPEIAVGRNMRLSSPQLATALLKGITDQGTKAIDLGLVTTDGLYFAVGKFNYSAGVMITASHNSGKYNGMKFCRAHAFPISLESGLAEIRDLAVSGHFSQPAAQGQITKRGILDDYVNQGNPGDYATCERNMTGRVLRCQRHRRRASVARKGISYRSHRPRTTRYCLDPGHRDCCHSRRAGGRHH
jgi:phosphomannomutase